MYRRVATEAPCKAAWRRQKAVSVHSASLHFSLSDPAGTIFAVSSPTSTPLRAVKFGDALCYQVVNGLIRQFLFGFVSYEMVV
jgi:hypothetical protein